MNIDLRTAAKAVVSLAAICAPACPCGCAEKHIYVWTPKPGVHWEDIAGQPVPPLRNEYRILIPQPTKGLFPAAIGVTRVAVEHADDEPLRRGRHLVRDPRNELLRWNSAFDDQMAISEVFPVAQRNLAGGEAEPELILAAKRALNARLSLVYAMNEPSEIESEMIGALYDTESAKLVAAFHAQAVSVLPPEEERDKEPVDLWESDSKALVRAKFEHLVYACIRDLILHDEPAPIEAPSGWVPVGPIQPVEWPPRLLRSGP